MKLLSSTCGLLLLIAMAAAEAGPTVSLSATPAPPQPAGTIVTITSHASGSGVLTYRWWLYDGTAWSMATDWTTSGVFQWTPQQAGSAWQIGVWLQDDTGQQAYAAIPYPVSPSQSQAQSPPSPTCGPLSLSGAGSIPSDPPGPTWVELSATSPYTQSPYTEGSQGLPYTVPVGWTFYLTDAAFQTKAVPGAWPSYAVISGIFTLTTDAPRLHLQTPLALPSGFVLTVGVHNNTASNPVNMIVLINGVLAETWSRYQTCR